MVDFAILAIVAITIVSGFIAAERGIQLAKAKIAAVALANEKMEVIRNMPYDELSTAHGNIYPPGEILDAEQVGRKNMDFSVQTTIRYVDDPYDGNFNGTIEGKPQDIYPYDYKKAEIKVYKVGRSDPLAVLTTNISAKAAETPTNTGILYLCVIDSENKPVEGALATVQNITTDPPVDMQFTTDSTGCVMVPALPPELHNQYHVFVTKDGFSLDMTYPRTSQNPNELQPDINIFAQQVTNLTLAIDKVSTIRLHAVDLAGAPVPGLTIHVEDSKQIYFNPITYKYSQDHETDGDGNLILEKMEWGDYKFSILTDGKYLSATSPMQPVHLYPNTEIDITILVTDSTGAPRISNFTPVRGVGSDITTITITGDNFDNLPIVKLRNSVGEILGTNIAVHSGKTIEADFNLALGSPGIYEIYIENSGGEFAVQPNAFEIVAP